MTDERRPGDGADPGSTDPEGAQLPGRDRTDGDAVGYGGDPVLELAERHADLLDDPKDGPALRTAPDGADAATGAVFAALDRVRADLATEPAPAPPPGLLAGIDRALAAERSQAPRGVAIPGTHPASEPSAAPGSPPPRPSWEHRPSRPSRRPRALVAALAAVVLTGLAGGVAALTAGPPTVSAPAPPTVQAVSPSSPPADLPVVHRDDLPSALRAGLGGRADAAGGPLADPVRLTECLAAHGVPPGVRPAGVRRVLVDGTPRVLMVLPTGVAARFRVLVVGDGCSAATPLTLADAVVGR